ncbi:aspartyl-phosphate phosphatase Spo0E family protein [Thermobacillus composti]|nr:aspartyl-phosphate phosphatase Spo0E family protein [Thermobacillus composti]
MDKKERIESAIERKRNELNEAGRKYGLGSPVVLSKSQELDDLLNKFMMMKRQAAN